MERIVQAAIRAALPGGRTWHYFENERAWEAPMRQRFSKITGAIAADKVRAQSPAIDLLEDIGNWYKAIWKDTRITYSVFYGCTHDVIDRRGWWSSPPPRLFGATDAETVQIAGAVEETLAEFARRKDARNYSLLTKWLHFCFPETFAIFDGQAAKSIDVASFRVPLPPGVYGGGRDQFCYLRTSDTNGTGYIGLLNFYRLFWEAACSSGLATNVQQLADAVQAMLRGQPGCADAQVSTLDILDKLLWKAEGSQKALGLDSPNGGTDGNMIEAVARTSIYVDDIDQAEAFYRDVLGLKVIEKGPERSVGFQVGNDVLMAFNPETTLKDDMPPPHGARGPGNFALSVFAEAMDGWRRRLEGHGVAVEKDVAWPRGGRSIYFRDPAGNSVELVAQGVSGRRG